MTTTTQKSFVQQSFEKAFDNVAKVEFDTSWHHGDYMNGAVHYKLDPGVIVGSTAAGKDARRMLLIGTRAGTVVIFERYSPNGDSGFVLVSNTPHELRFILPSGSMDDSTFSRVVTPYSPRENIGTYMETVFKLNAPTGRIS